MYRIYQDLHRAHHQDMLRAARQLARERQAQAAQTPRAAAQRPAWQTRALAWCGDQLVGLGERLQAAASVESAEPPSMISECCAESVA